MNKPSRRLAALFVICIAALYPPLLVAFNRSVSFLGIPLLPLYLFTTWGMLVLISWLLSRGGES
ncbi:MAG: hypothetical protein WA003_00095 [Desulfuromonadaceae bacterium]